SVAALGPVSPTNSWPRLVTTAASSRRRSIAAWSLPRWTRIASAPRSLEHQARVGAAEAEAVGQRDIDAGAARLVRDVVEVAQRVGVVEVDRRRQHLVVQRQRA